MENSNKTNELTLDTDSEETTPTSTEPKTKKSFFKK
jgi:hypothetical protein